MYKNTCHPAKLLLVCLLLLPVAADERTASLRVSGRLNEIHQKPDFLPKDNHDPDADERTRLRVVWHEVRQENGRLILPGTLFLESKDRKSKKPIDWVQGVRVLISRKPKLRPDWSEGHNFNWTAWKQNSSETGVADCVISENGSFAAEFDNVTRTVGRTEEFQVGLCLALQVKRTITFKNTLPVLPQTVATVPIAGPNPLNQTLQIINAAPPTIDLDIYDPVALIRAVNHLQSIGKTKAIAALRDFLKIAKRRRRFSSYSDELDPANIDTGDRRSVFLIVQLLFEPDNRGEERPGVYGNPSRTPSTQDKSLWPHFPIALHDDVPFLLTRNFGPSLGFGQDDPTQNVEWAEKHGMLRKRKLRPPDNPLAAVDTFLSLPKTKRLLGRSGSYGFRGPVRRQAWRMIETVVRPPSSRDAFSSRPGYNAEPDWQKHKVIAKPNQILWDATHQRYTRQVQNEEQ